MKKMGKPNIKAEHKRKDISWKNEIDYFSKILSDGQKVRVTLVML